MLAAFYGLQTDGHFQFKCRRHCCRRLKDDNDVVHAGFVAVDTYSCLFQPLNPIFQLKIVSNISRIENRQNWSGWSDLGDVTEEASQDASDVVVDVEEQIKALAAALLSLICLTRRRF